MPVLQSFTCNRQGAAWNINEWLMIMTVMQDGEGKPFEDPPGPAPQTAALAFKGD